MEIGAYPGINGFTYYLINKLYNIFSLQDIFH